MGYWFTETEADLDFSGINNIASKIKKIKEEMKVDVNTLGFDDICSIPDAWHIHRIFEMMLVGLKQDDDKAEDKDVLRKFQEVVKNNWFAILAVVILGEDIGLTIVDKKVNGDTFKNDKMLSSVWNSRPNISIWEKAKDQEMTIKCVVDEEGKLHPIAMSSLKCFYVPTPGAWETLGRFDIKNKIKWIKENGSGKYEATNPCLMEGALTEPMRKKLKKEFAKYAEKTGAKDYKTDCDSISKLLKEAEKMSEDIQKVDIFPDDMVLHYLEIPDDKPADDTENINPKIGGIAKECICTKKEREDDKYIHYVVTLPLSEEAIKWLLDEKKETSFKIELGESDNSTENFVATYTIGGKTFNKTFSNELVEKEEYNDGALDVSLLWPRYKIKNWEEYYAYHYEYRTKGLGNRYFLTPEKESIDREEIFSGPEEDTSFGTLHSYKLKRWPRKWTLTKIFKNNGDEEVLGNILTRSINVSDQEKGAFMVSVDFGTSSTMMYCKNSNNKIVPIDGINIWSLPILVDDNGFDLRGIYGYFIPPVSDKGSTMAPLQSILARWGNTERNTSFLMGYWPYFRQFTEKQSKQSLPKFIKSFSNLKWEVKEKTQAEAFLTSLSYLLALEARKNGCKVLKVIATYPYAKEGAKSKYSDALTKQINSVCESTGLQLENDKIHLLTESEAVARKIIEEKKDTIQFCSIDIGGGTTDIFLFKPGEETSWKGYESSIICGARDILLDNFCKDNSLLKTILESGDEEIKKAICKHETRIYGEWASETTEEKTKANIEYLLALEFKDSNGASKIAGDEICEMAMNAGNDEIIKMREAILYRIGAIMYYAGMMTIGKEFDLEELYLCFSGNGSKTLRWISDKEEKQKLFISDMFNAGAGASTKKQKPDNIVFSSDHKHEVAKGALILMDKLGEGNNTDQDELKMESERTILAGEDVTVISEGQKRTWEKNRNISDKTFDTKIMYETRNEEIKKFLIELRQNASKLVKCDHLDSKVCDKAGIKYDINVRVKKTMNDSESTESFFMIGADEVFKELFK